MPSKLALRVLGAVALPGAALVAVAPAASAQEAEMVSGSVADREISTPMGDAVPDTSGLMSDQSLEI